MLPAKLPPSSRQGLGILDLISGNFGVLASSGRPGHFSTKHTEQRRNIRSSSALCSLDLPMLALLVPPTLQQLSG